MTNKFPLSLFFSTHFSSHLSTGFKKLMAPPNYSLNEFSKEEQFSMWQQTVMDTLNLFCKIKTTRGLQIYKFYFPQLIIWSKNFVQKKFNYRNGTVEKLHEEVSLFVELDRIVLIGNLSLHSTRCCFKFLCSFSPNFLLNQMDWKNVKASTNNKLVDLINILFNSVFRKILDETLQPLEHPTIR